MSLVQAYVHNDFIVVGADEKAIFEDHISDTYRKIYKLNSTTIVGMCGSIGGNVHLFGNYINSDFSINIACENMTFTEIKNDLINTFNEKQAILNMFSVHSIVCGWDGEKMVCYTMFTQDSDPDVNGIHEIIPNGNDARIVNCGDLRHNENAIAFGKEINNINILQLKNLFRQVIDAGVQFDNTINKNIDFETIRKYDVYKGK